MPLAVAKRLDDDEAAQFSNSAQRFLAEQQAKPVEKRLSDLEAWQVGANEYLATIEELRDLFAWMKKAVTRWFPIVAAAALGSHTLADFVDRLIHAAGYK